ncbi:MAG: AraC family transcriptional regulator [Cellvibrionaceae bacterium]
MSDTSFQRVTIPSHYLRVLRDEIESAGHDFDVLLEEQGISQELYHSPDGMAHPDQFVGLIHRSWALLDDEFLGLTAEPCSPGLFSLMVRYVAQLDTLQAVLKECVRFYRITRRDLRVDYEITDTEVFWFIDLVEPNRDKDHFMSEFLLVVFHRFLCWISGTKIFPKQLRLSYSKPSHVKHYTGLFNCDHHFDCARSGFSFDKKYLSCPVVIGAEELREFLEHAPAQLMVTPGTDNSYATRIKGIALRQQREGRGFPDFVTVASELCVSPQTLRRKLQAEDSSYQTLKDILRRDIAIDKLVNEKLSVAEIGQILGFVEPASFTRAFKQWTGVSPAQYRSDPSSSTSVD